jgi:hypothetical protein
MVRGISKKQQRADLRRKRDKTASGLALGAKKPPKAIPHPRLPSESMFGKGRPQKWPGFTPPHSRKMPPLRGLLLLRRVQVRRAPFGDQADADTKSTTSADSLADISPVVTERTRTKIRLM